MLAPPGELLQLGLEQRLNRVKRATQSYMRDRARQATGTVTSYVVAAGLFATAGLFLIAACIVGLTALFRWVEMTYGLFT
ncbi:MAG: phage holin family protein, partial [Bradyrhizobium sp.]|nr:phage holin family protein [Bradyrhizobium sp.]